MTQQAEWPSLNKQRGRTWAAEIAGITIFVLLSLRKAESLDLIFQLSNTRFGGTCTPIQEVDCLSHFSVECLLGVVCLLLLSIVTLLRWELVVLPCLVWIWQCRGTGWSQTHRALPPSASCTWPYAQLMVNFSYHWDRRPDRSNLREEGWILRGCNPLWCGGRMEFMAADMRCLLEVQKVNLEPGLALNP